MDLSEIRILLLGDDNVGRTSLIYSLVSEDVVPSNPLMGDASVRPTTDDISIPPEVTRARVPTVIMDYCGRQPMSPDEIDDLLLPMECPSPNPLLQSSRSLYSCIRQAHVICLVYAIDSRESRDRLLSVWLPLIDRSATTIPIILVANKFDLVDDETQSINNDENREFFRLTMLKYSRIEACIETSTRTMKNISELFYSAQKCVLYPINYLSESTNKLSKRLKQCLKRIFTIADQDHDQLLNDCELTNLQDFCFGKHSTNNDKTTIEQLKREIKRRTPNGIQNLTNQITALTYQGFECLFELYLNKGKYETIYTTLERFNYNRKLELCVPNAPEDLAGELSPSAIDYLTGLFRRFDQDHDSCLTLNELNQLFESFIEIIPSFPQSLSKIQHCIYLRLNSSSSSTTTSKTPLLTLSGYLAQWFFLAQSQPSLTYSYLFQLGYSYALSTIDDTRLPSRMTYICHVYGMSESGKSSFLKRFVSSTIYQVRHSADLAEKLNNKTKAFFSYDYSSKVSVKQKKFYAVDFVRVLNETKCLILEECHRNETDEKLTFPQANVNCFLIDRTHPRAFSNVATIYLQQTDYPRLPCLFLLTKADQLSVKQDYPLPIEFFCRQHKIPLPIDYSALTSQSIYSNLNQNQSQLQTTTEHMSQSWFTNLLFRSQTNSNRNLEPYSPRGDKTRHQDDIYVRLGYLCVYPKLNYFTNSTSDFTNTDALLKYSLYASVVTLGLVTVARMFR